MIQQTIQIGNSIGVIIPKNVLEEQNIKLGDKIHMDAKPVEKMIGDVDGKFMQMANEFIEEHKDVLEALANR